MSNNPRVSICLLTWNRADVIRRSIDSLLAQTFQDFELIINDDRSTDNTAEICREYEALDTRVRYCCNETNLKYSGNSNEAVRRANGEFIMFAHDGDLYHPEMIQQWVDGLDQAPSAGLAFCALNVMKHDGSLERTDVQPWDQDINGRELLEHMLLRFDSPIFGITMVRRSALDNVGEFDSQFPRITDVDMWLRILARYDAVYIKKPLIDVMPREEGHENSGGPNWSIARQVVGIRKLNIERAFDKNTPQYKTYANKFRKDRFWYYARSIGWCVKRGQLGRAFTGAKELLSGA